jgi:REP element-mobilizing transposase RayT
MAFAVKYRRAVLDKKWRSQVQAIMGNLINESGSKTIIVNGVEDHMHCFVNLRPAVSVWDLMKIVKAKSSKYINDHTLTKERFEWQDGYGVFSYRQRDVQRIYNYILNQEEHRHKKLSGKNTWVC